MMNRIQSIGRATLAQLSDLGRATLILVQAVFGGSRVGVSWRLTLDQIHVVGVLSLSIILVSGLFIGMVLGLQGYTILRDYGSEQALGQMVALSLTRELGPVVTALLFAGRAGSALTAEIGLMKQPSSLRVLR
jgi:ABC-type transport system involved in resistance to organic solvents, permease component